MNIDGSSDVWILIPAFNESQVIGTVVRDVRAAFEHVVVIDDGSADDTREQAAAAGATVLSHPVNLGQGAALQTGITFALRQGAPYIVTFDADGQHDIADVLPMLELMRRQGLDVVLGSRFLGKVVGMPPGRRALLRCAVLFTRLTTGLRLTDAHNGLRLLSRHAAGVVSLRHNRMAHASEILAQIARHRLTYREIGNTVRYSDYSRTKGQRSSNAINIVVDLLAARLDR